MDFTGLSVADRVHAMSRMRGGIVGKLFMLLHFAVAALAISWQDSLVAPLRASSRILTTIAVKTSAIVYCFGFLNLDISRACA
jgi:hypothetical protein